MKSKIKGCTHHSSKVISKFRNGGEVGGIGGGSGVDGSGNRGNGGFGGGNSGNQGGGGMGGGGMGGVGGAMNSSVKTGMKPVKAMGTPIPTSAPPPKISMPAAKPVPVGMAAPKPAAKSPTYGQYMNTGVTAKPYNVKKSPDLSSFKTNNQNPAGATRSQKGPKER